MKLKDQNLAPVGQWRFEYDVPVSDRFPSGVYKYNHKDASNLKKFVTLVKGDMIENHVAVPENLFAIVEDFVCSYQPSERCSYSKGFGDRISKVIHTTARVVDNLTGSKLEKKARGCRSCGRRRTKLN